MRVLRERKKETERERERERIYFYMTFEKVAKVAILNKFKRTRS